MTTPTDLPELLRREVGLFRAGERRRKFPLTIHVGLYGGPRRSFVVGWPEPAEYDAALRFDLVCALLTTGDAGDAAPPVGERKDGAPRFAWVSRPGVPEIHDCDLPWFAAADQAFAACGVELLGFHAITRSGWLDVRDGDRRAWKRLRLRDRGGGSVPEVDGTVRVHPESVVGKDPS